MIWALRRIGEGSSPLVVHVPHAGTWIPQSERGRLLLDDAELVLELQRMTDWHTDRLALDALAEAGVAASVFINRASRLLVDPERFTDDSEPMAAIGMGAVYLVTSHLRPLRRPDPADDRRLVEQWFDPYTAAFTRQVDESLAAQGRAVIVDLHSYPSVPLPYELDPTAPRPGVCIGTDPDHTPAVLARAASEAFAGVHSGVAENTPFAGTYVPLAHWRRVPEVTSVMIEIRRDLYQEEPGGALRDGYGELRDRLAAFLTTLSRT